MKNMKSYLWMWFLTLCVGAMIPATATAVQEGVVLDPATGDYTITYFGIGGATDWHQVVFVPATKIDPIIKSEFQETKNGVLTYTYKVKNGHQAKQALVGIRMLVMSTLDGSLVTPQGWSGLADADLTIGKGFTVSWVYPRKKVADGLAPGKTQHGFSVNSYDLPGVADVEFWGASMAPAFPDEGPDLDSEVGKQFEQLNNNNFVHRYAVAPLIAVPASFDAAVVLSNIQKHVSQDLVTMKLVDPTFASQLDRLFQAAIDAAKGGNTVALKADIKDLRRMLKREHTDVDKDDEWDRDDDDGKDKEKDKSRQIDKLATKVLDFDLKYIQKRLGHDD